jgi:DNA-binding MarR family transcriptional regulator
MPPDAAPPDSVDRLIAEWRTVRPDLDFSPLGVVARLGRVRAHIDRELEAQFSRHGITAPGFAVLVTLARLQEPDGVPQRRLMEELGLTSGTVSVRIDRLEADGLVARAADAGDRRNTRITLTERGRDLFERVVPEHLGNERRLLAALDAGEREALASLLRTLLVEFEGSCQDGAAAARLGVTLAPAHVAIAMRRAVGLEPVEGLLVREVEEGTPAAAAGVLVGDVIRAAGGRPVASVGVLRRALAGRARRGALELVVRRGEADTTLRVRLGGAGRAGPVAAVPRGLHRL